MNVVILMGRLMADPYYKAAEKDGEVSFAKFRLAVKKNWRRKGENDYRFPITIFGTQADNLARLCKKGTKIVIHGELSEGGYQDKTTKQWVYTWDVIANEWEFAESKKNSEKAPQEETPEANIYQPDPEIMEEAPVVPSTPKQEAPKVQAPVQNNYGDESIMDDGVPEGFFTNFADFDLPFG